MKAEFRCGHVGIVPELKADEQPICLQCGTVGVARSFAPPPRFRGTAMGPHVDPCDLPAITVSLAQTDLPETPDDQRQH